MQVSQLAPIIRTDEPLKPAMKAELERIFRTSLDLAGLKLEELESETKRELKRLQSSAEHIEAIFVRSLLEQMKLGAIGDGGPMGDFAQDLSTQAVAESLATNGSGLGIARLVFASTAETILRSMIAPTEQPRLEIKA